MNDDPVGVPAMNPVDQFAQERRDRLAGYAQDTAFQTL